MERIAETPCIVLRDYAHTPDALERALATLRPLTRGRLIVVFGCGGDRDRGKRPIMGRIAAELADLAIATSDNPRTEDPGAIIDDIEQGMGGVPHLRIVDRLAAIHAALDEAGAGDTLLLAGKGHETYQVLGTEKVPFDEREIVRAARAGHDGGADTVPRGASPPGASAAVARGARAAEPRAAPAHVHRRSDRHARHRARCALRGAGRRAFRRPRLPGRRRRRREPPAWSFAEGRAPVAGAHGCSTCPTRSGPSALLARARRRTLTGPVVAVTGTNGKTSTKEMLAAVLGTRFRVYATRANLNNLVGVPPTILEAPDDADALVVEAGANLPGEIARYREIIEPSLAVDHQRRPGPSRGLRLARRRGGGEAVARRRRAARDRRHRAAGARGGGPAPRPRVRTAALERATSCPTGSSSTRTRGRCSPSATPRFTLAVRGLHQADNATRVWAVVEALDLDRQAAARALERFAIPAGRGELLEQGGLTDPQRLLQRQPADLPRRDRDRAGAPARPAARVHRRDHAGAG